MARLSLEETTRRRRRRRHRRNHNITWQDLHCLVTQAQATCPPNASLSAILLAAIVILHANSASAQQAFLWRFSVRETFERTNTVIGTGDCSPRGCQTALEIPIKPQSVSVTPASFACFPYRNRGDCLTDTPTYGGCRRWSCVIEFSTSKGSIYQNIGGELRLKIEDPWDERWRVGVHGKLYHNGYSSCPTADISISRSLVPAPPSEQVKSRILSQANNLRNSTRTPFTWIQYIQYATNLLRLSSHPNVSQCFLCASLTRPLLAAVPVNVSLFTTDTTLESSSPPLRNIPLYSPLNPPVCLAPGTSTPSSRCLLNITVSTSLCASPPVLFWCGGTILPCINTTLSSYCIPVAVTPQLLLFEKEEAISKMTTRRPKREILIPLLIGLGLTISTGSAGLAGGALYQAHLMEADFQGRLEQAISSTTESLEALQRQITSLAEVVLQNRRALDLITAEHGGTCMLLKEECCFYVNDSGVVETNVKNLLKLKKELSLLSQNPTETSWYSSPVITWLLPLLGPLLAICALLLLAPCLIQFLQGRLKALVNVATQRVMIKYQTIPKSHDYDDTSPL